MTIRDKIKPFVIVDYNEGAALQLYSVEDYKQELFDSRKSDGFTGNGYDWTTLAKLFIEEEMPDILADIQFDPEASMFTVYADEAIILESLAVGFKAALDNDDYIYPLFARIKGKIEAVQILPKNHSAVVSAVVLNDKSEILLVENPNGDLDLPYGEIYSGEDIIDAAKRVIHEKTGIGAEITAVGGISKNLNEDTIIIEFICQYKCGEAVNSVWLEINSALNSVTAPIAKKRLENMLSGERKLSYFSYKDKPLEIVNRTSLDIGM